MLKNRKYTWGFQGDEMEKRRDLENFFLSFIEEPWKGEGKVVKI